VAEDVEFAESVSIAMLTVLETLAPAERAVFVLREVFDLPYADIAPAVDKTPAAVRQIAHRARKHVEARRPRFESTREEREELAGRFFAALGEGNMDELVQLLADDAATYADGGGKAPALTQSVQGNVRVARFLLGLQRYAERMRFMVRPAWVNGELGFVAFDAEGRVVSATALEIREGRIQAIRSIANPDKLRHIGSGKRAP
jgi:RNA polymerase sigma-70 factor (ECF subfamily)